MHVRVLHAGGAGLLKKPFDDNSFAECLEKALKGRKADQ
jgi:FixJ family two-component response regulator